MFSSILLGALMACNQPATAAEYVPGVLKPTVNSLLLLTVAKSKTASSILC